MADKGSGIVFTPDGGQPEQIFPTPPPTDLQVRAPTRFERGRDIAEAPIRGGLKLLPGMSDEMASGVAQTIVPQTPADLGMQIATVGMPGAGQAARFAENVIGREVGPVATRAIRYGLPAAGAVVGDIAGRGLDVVHNAYEAGRGALFGVAGDLAPIGKAVIGRKGAIQKADQEAVGKGVETLAPMLGAPRTVQDLDRVAVRNAGAERMRAFGDNLVKGVTDRLETIAGRAADRRPGVIDPARKGSSMIEVPALREMNGGEGGMTLKRAMEHMRRLSEQGWTEEDQRLTGMNATQARALREKAREQVVGALEKAEKGLGSAWDSGMNQLSKAHFMIETLQQPGVIAEGKLNMNALRDAMAGKYDQGQTRSQRLERIASPDEVAAFYEALTRKSGDLVSRDVPGSIGIGGHVAASALLPGAGASMPVHGWFSKPRLPKYVGELPPIRIGSGGTPVSLGLEKLAQETRDSERR